MKKIAVLFHRLGPYHHARLTACGTLCDLTAIEIMAKDSTYAWDKVAGARNYDRRTLFQETETVHHRADLVRRIHATLEETCPDAVVIPGWSDRGALAALFWSLERHIPVVIMSDSQERDELRRWWKEAVKRQVIVQCGAGLVGGAPHAAYLAQLGMPADHIYSGYDVVDNEYFQIGASSVRRSPGTLRERHVLPEHFFLASNRFVAKKNLERLIKAFSRYQRMMANRGWHLVILGDGELRSRLEALLKEYGMADRVLLPGFKQYPDLPVFYGLASAFVHASTTEQWGLVVNEAMASDLPVLVSKGCGCAFDLVREGVNGFTFDPYDVDGLASLMVKMASGEVDREAMGRASQKIIDPWSPKTFARNLLAATEAAVRAPKPPFSFIDRLFLKGLLLR